MKRIKYVAMGLGVLMALPGDLLAVGKLGSKWFQLNNRIRVEYDDNINSTDSDEQDSMKYIVEPELFFNFNMEQTFLSLRYRPQFVWWSDRESDDTDLNHDIDFVFNHDFSPRFSLSLKDTFRIAEQSAQIDRGTSFSQDNDFLYNSVAGALTYAVRPETWLDLLGRFQILRYDNDDVAVTGDYDITGVGIDLRHQLQPETQLSLELRGESTEYDKFGTSVRDSESYEVGVGGEQTFSPNLVAGCRLGLQHKTFEDDGIDDSDEPYIEATMTVLPSPATRVSAGLGYDQAETDVFPYANQDRFRLFGSVSHDFTARITWNLSATYILNNLDSDQAISGTQVDESGDVLQDGDETIGQLSTRLAYRLNRSNSLEAGWQLINLDSDVREDYLRNRLSLGWKTEI